MDLSRIEQLIEQNNKRNTQIGIVISAILLPIAGLIIIGNWVNYKNNDADLSPFYVSIAFGALCTFIFVSNIVKLRQPQKIDLSSIDSARIVYPYKKPLGTDKKIELPANIYLKVKGRKQSFQISRKEAEDLIVFFKQSGIKFETKNTQIRRSVIT